MLRSSLSTTWQFFLAIAGVGLALVVLSMLGLRFYFTYNFNAYLAAQEQQRLQELAVLVADFYDLQRLRDENFQFQQLDDIQRGGARRLLAGLTAAQWRSDARSAREERAPLSGPASRFNFRDISLYDIDGTRVSGRDLRTSEQSVIEVPILAGDPVRQVGYLVSLRPEGPMQPIDSVFQQQQLSAIAIAAGLAILAAAIAAGWLARRLRQRVNVLTQATRSLARGQYDVRLPATGRDDLAQLSTDINRLASSLQSATQQRRDFMADVAHELRTPLTILQAELEAIEDGIRSLDAQQMGLLQGQVRQLTQLVDDVHTLAQADIGSLTYRWQDLDMSEWLQRMWPSLAHQAEAIPGIEVSLHAPSQPAWVQADPERLAQLLQNLWSNSLRYTDAPGQISLRLDIAPNQVVLVLEDSAPGVPEHALSRIFERLYRVDSSRNRANGGSGLGLTLVQRIAHAHGGDVTASPSQLGGLRVEVTLSTQGRGAVDSLTGAEHV